jgi:hypothetical protein
MTNIRRLAVAMCGGVLCAGAAAQNVVYTIQGATNAQLLSLDPATGNVVNSLDITNEEALFGSLTREGTDLWTIDGWNDSLSDRTFRIDSGTGAGATIGDTGENWNFRGVEIHPLTGVLYAANDTNLYTLDKTTGAATLIASLTANMGFDQLTSIAIHPNGTAYAVDVVNTSLFQLDLATGVLTHLHDLNLGFGPPAHDIAFDGLGQMWVLMIGGGGVFTVDVGTGVSNFEFASSGAWNGLAFGGCTPPVNYCTAGTTSQGCTPAIVSSGSPSVSALSGFTLGATNIDANRVGLFFYGVSDVNFTPLPWGTGGTSFLCVKPPTQRMGAMASGGSTGCTGSYSQDWRAYLAANPGALGNPLLAGASFDAQLWMRDPPSPKSTILSNAVRFSICP